MTRAQQDEMPLSVILNLRNEIAQYGLMANDQRRNQFYEKILANEIVGQTVVEPGYGTGVLAFLALKAGAQKVIAYEERPDTCEVARQILRQTSRASQVELVNERYSGELLGGDCLIHEVVGQEIWSEFLYYIVRDLKMRIYPGEYFINVFFHELTPQYLATLDHVQREAVQNTIESFSGASVDPNPREHGQFEMRSGVELDSDFCAASERAISTITADSRYHELQYRGLPISFLEANRNGQKSFYRLDLNRRSMLVGAYGSERAEQSLKGLPAGISIPVYRAQQDTQLCVSFEFGVAHGAHELLITENYPHKSWDQADPREYNRLFRVPSGRILYLTQLLTDGRYCFHL